MSKLALVAALAVPALAHAAPMTIQHSARLVDSTGNPVDGPVSVTVQLFDAETDGLSLWTRTFTPTATQGYVTLTLADGTPSLSTSVFDSPEVWLELQVGTEDPMSPRTRLSSTPYALQADRADHVHIDTTPATGACTDGALDVDVATRTLQVCVGSAWVEVSSGGALGTQANPAASCQALHTARPTAGDGTYWIVPGPGINPLQVWCDMDATGGWTLAYVMCQDSTGSILSMDRSTPIVPGAAHNPSSLTWTAVTELNPSKIRFTSDFRTGLGYVFDWSTVTGGHNFAKVLFSGVSSNHNTCDVLGVPLAGSSGATCSMSIEHNNAGSEPYDIPSLGCGCAVWDTGGMMWGQIDDLAHWHGLSHRLTHSVVGSNEAGETTDGCIEIYVQ